VLSALVWCFAVSGCSARAQSNSNRWTLT
jgi:hypothetical protein